jgi:hypothetical protein
VVIEFSMPPLIVTWTLENIKALNSPETEPETLHLKVLLVSALTLYFASVV